MTKWFTYFDDKPLWTEEDFFEYFEGKEDVFESWLKTSYEMSVTNSIIWKVTAVISNCEAEYTVVYKNGYSYPAGTEECFSASELWNGFTNRIYDAEKYITK